MLAPMVFRFVVLKTDCTVKNNKRYFIIDGAIVDRNCEI